MKLTAVQIFYPTKITCYTVYRSVCNVVPFVNIHTGNFIPYFRACLTFINTLGLVISWEECNGWAGQQLDLVADNDSTH